MQVQCPNCFLVTKCECPLLVVLQAALGVNTSLFTLSFVVFNFLATATTPAVAAAVGARNSTAAGEVVYQATALAVLLGLGVAVGLHGNASWMLSVMGADPSQGEHMHDLAMQYLMIRWVVWRSLQAHDSSVRSAASAASSSWACNVVDRVFPGALGSRASTAHSWQCAQASSGSWQLASK
jgi:hypothetical protein